MVSQLLIVSSLTKLTYITPIKNADYEGTVDLGAGSDLFYFGGWGGGAAAGPLWVDMGEEKIDGNPYGDDFQLRKGLTKDNDVVVLRKTVDKYRFEYDGDNDQIGVEDLESNQVVVFQNVEHFRVDGLKVDGSRAVDVLTETQEFLNFNGLPCRKLR